MSKKCDVCGKAKVFGNKVTFSNRKSNRSWAPNIRKVRAVVNGTPKRVMVCTRCLRSGLVQRAL
jgi:large subunit ribosomal protein L28